MRFHAGAPHHRRVSYNPVLRLELPNIRPDSLHGTLGGGAAVTARVGGGGMLTPPDKSGIVHSPHHLHAIHLLPHPPHQIVVEDLLLRQRISQLRRSDIPSSHRGGVGARQSVQAIGVADSSVDSALGDLGDAAVVIRGLGLAHRSEPLEGFRGGAGGGGGSGKRLSPAVGDDSGKEGCSVGSPDAHNQHSDGGGGGGKRRRRGRLHDDNRVRLC
mmetsp:Transcript_25256/g.31049  ORF Transcript_25256/g.31049 Transcript_25256/m.31049 type:complete len:215 (+) Transcript_25256:1503-2147(+)